MELTVSRRATVTLTTNAAGTQESVLAGTLARMVGWVSIVKSNVRTHYVAVYNQTYILNVHNVVFIS